MSHTYKIFSLFIFFLSTTVLAESLTLSSNDIKTGELMSKAQEFNGFGCSGSDLSPHLKWVNAPQGTKSFAITAYDPDAPTGSGWWHWQLINIPASTSELASGDGDPKKQLTPKGSVHVQNDYGIAGFGGACPPAGHGIHHYQFTIHALSVERLDLPETASGALTGYMINANTIASSTIEALYKRD